MNSRNEPTQTKTSAPQSRSYTTPTLVVYGEVRHLTQGGTVGDVEVMNNSTNFMP